MGHVRSPCLIVPAPLGERQTEMNRRQFDAPASITVANENPVRTVRRLTDAVDADDARLPPVDAERTAVSLQRADTAGAITLQQPVATRFPAEDPTIPATAAARAAEFPLPEHPTVSEATNAHSLHKQSVPGELSAYANVSAAAAATEAATAAAAAAATASGLDYVPDIGQPERVTPLHTACPDRPELSVERQSTGEQ